MSQIRNLLLICIFIVQLFIPYLATANSQQSASATSATSASSTTTEITFGIDFPSGVTPLNALNFDPKDKAAYHHSTSITVFDSIGQHHPVDFYFIRVSSNTWAAYYFTFDNNGNRLPIDIQGGAVGAQGQLYHTINFDEQGTYLSSQPSVLITDAINFSNGSNPNQTIQLDFALNNSIQSESGFTIRKLLQNGFNDVALASSQLNISVNLDSTSSPLSIFTFSPDTPSTYHFSAELSVVDSLGEQHIVTAYFVYTGNREWAIYYNSVDANNNVLALDIVGGMFGAGGQLVQIISFDEQGSFQSSIPNPSVTSAINFANGSDPTQVLTFNYVATKTTQTASPNKLGRILHDGLTTSHYKTSSVYFGLEFADVPNTLNPLLFDSNNAETYHFSNSQVVYDSLGKSHPLNSYFLNISEHSWAVYYESIDNNLAKLPIDVSGGIAGSAGQLYHEINFNVAGNLESTTPGRVSTSAIDFGNQSDPTQSIAMDYALYASSSKNDVFSAYRLQQSGINSVGEVPSISGTPTTQLFEDETFDFTPTASNANNDALTFRISNKPDWLSFERSSGALTGAPSSGEIGTYEDIIIEVTDGLHIAALPAFTITVLERNVAPTIEGQPTSSIFENDDYNFIPIASDANGDSLNFSITNQPAWANFDTLTGELSGTPGDGDIGTYPDIIISVTDGQLESSLAAFTITVNEAPESNQGSGALFYLLMLIAIAGRFRNPKKYKCK